MSYQVSVRKKGDKFVAGINAEAAYQACADTLRATSEGDRSFPHW